MIAGTGNEAAQVHMLRRLTGAKIRSVSGYAGGGAMNLAIQRGEVDGRCSYSWEAIKSASVPDWVRDRKAKPIVQFALQRHPELPDVPLILDYARTELDRAGAARADDARGVRFPAGGAAGRTCRRCATCCARRSKRR